MNQQEPYFAPQPPLPPQAPSYPPPPYGYSEQKTVYTVGQGIFALLTLPFGYLFRQWVLRAGNAACLYVLLFAAFSLGVLLVTHLPKKKRPRPAAVVLLTVNTLLAGVYLISPPSSVTALTTIFEIFSFLLFYLYAFSDAENCPLGDGMPLDIIKAVFILPFVSFFSIFPALFSLLKSKTAGRKVGMVLLGIAIAVIPSAIVIALLGQADAAFGNLMSEIGSFLFGSNPVEVFLNFGSFIFSIPVSMYLFGAVYSGWEGKQRDTLNAASQKRLAASISVIPVTVTISAILPLCLIYLLFFFSQLGYYVDAFSDLVPAGYSTAQYARSGFFQLCAVSAINLCLITVASLFVQKKDGKQTRPVRMLNTVLSVFTLVLIATALRKMILYIGLYGFTRLRILTSVFMIFLGLVFLFLVIRQITPRCNVVLLSAVAGTVLLGTVGFCDLDARIAQGNLILYQTGILETCDVHAFYDLSYTAAEYAIPLLEDDDAELAADAVRYLRHCARLISEGTYASDWRSETPALYRIASLLSEALGEEVTVPRGNGS